MAEYGHITLGPGGGIGRRAGFRCRWPLMAVEVRVFSWAPLIQYFRHHLLDHLNFLKTPYRPLTGQRRIKSAINLQRIWCLSCQDKMPWSTKSLEDLQIQGRCKDVGRKNRKGYEIRPAFPRSGLHPAGFAGQVRKGNHTY